MNKWSADNCDPVKDILSAKKLIEKEIGLINDYDNITFEEFEKEILKQVAIAYDIPLKLLVVRHDSN